MPIVGVTHFVCGDVSVALTLALLGLLNNLSKHESAKKKLPVGDITRLVKPIMRIPDKVISKKDKGITALTVSNLLER